MKSAVLFILPGNADRETAHVHEVVRPEFCRLMQECKNLVAGETIMQTLGKETDAAV